MLEGLSRREPLVIVGIDPGTRSMGFGVVGRVRGQLRRVDHGAFQPPRDGTTAQKLHYLFEQVRALIAHHGPDLVALEQTFFHKNPQSTLRIGEARAVVLVAAADKGVPVIEYPTRLVKKSVTGFGGAEKLQVQEAVARELRLESLPTPHDAADALALALCALFDPALDPRFQVEGK